MRARPRTKINMITADPVLVQSWPYKACDSSPIVIPNGVTERPRDQRSLGSDHLICSAVCVAGVHRSEERHTTDVRNEIHEQKPVLGKGRLSQCAPRDRVIGTS